MIALFSHLTFFLRTKNSMLNLSSSFSTTKNLFSIFDIKNHIADKKSARGRMSKKYAIIVHNASKYNAMLKSAILCSMKCEKYNANAQKCTTSSAILCSMKCALHRVPIVRWQIQRRRTGAASLTTSDTLRYYMISNWYIEIL